MKKIIFGLCGLIAVFLLLGCTSAPREEKFKIGTILPLTGELSDQGQSSKNGITLAVEEINNSGGINGKQVEVVFEDSQCQPANAVSAFYKLVDVDEVDVLIGDICSSASLAIADLADERKMVLVNAGTVAKQLTDSPYVFRIWFSEEKLGMKIAEKAVQLGCDKMAILYVNNDFGKGFGDVVEEKFLELGGGSVLSQPFSQEETDFKTGILKAEDANSACYFLALYPDGLLSALKQMKEAGIKKATFAHGGIVGTAQTMNIGQGILEGVYAPFFVQPSKEFQAMYEAAFGGKAGVTADAAYDAVCLIAQAVSSNGSNPENIRAGMLQIKNFSGTTGNIAIDEKGETNRPLAMYQVIGGEMVEVE